MKAALCNFITTNSPTECGADIDEGFRSNNGRTWRDRCRYAHTLITPLHYTE